MKKLIFIAICLVSLNLSAQGNLQFNQVVTTNLTGSSTGAGAKSWQTLNVTVPVNKVWKITSASCRIQNAAYNTLYGGAGNNQVWILIDEAPIAENSTSGSRWIVNNSTPLWLQEGAHTIKIEGNLSITENVTVFGKVSILEFNIVP